MAASATTAIRVSKWTRDQRAKQAAQRGTSLTALVKDIARQAERERIFTSEREAQRLDALNPEAMAEQALWDETPLDDVD
jgi:hypothetical protein